MTQKELLRRIEALERRVAELEARPQLADARGTFIHVEPTQHLNGLNNLGAHMNWEITGGK